VRAASGLVESEERFRSFAENSADVLWIGAHAPSRLLRDVQDAGDPTLRVENRIKAVGKPGVALGRPARDVFPEAWHELGPMFARVLDGGEAVEVQDCRRQALPMRGCRG
jgi:hypothetical protein